MALTGNSVVECDIASELLIAELVLDDIAAVQATRKGKAREDAPCSDADIAFDLQASSLNVFIGALRDHQFASSIDRAIESDASQLWSFATLNQAERDDHRAAVALASGLDLPQQTTSQRMLEHTRIQSIRTPIEPSFARRGHASNVTVADMITVESGMQDVHIDAVSFENAGHSSRTIGKHFECVICGDRVVESHSLKAPCDHRHCRGCVVDLVKMSLRDEQLHPLRCCHQPLPLVSGVFRFISTSLQLQFLSKNREYSVPAGSRVYCANLRCSSFLGASEVWKKDLTCDNCGTTTCSQCKDTAHPRKSCAEHQLTPELRQLAATNKWQTCPECHAIVELNHGCYHITCRCSAQFCYLCSARWKTCACRQWDEDQLLHDADRRVRNEFGNHAAAARPAVHAERVHRRMESLREDHECRTHHWRYRHGSGACEECGDHLGIYLMRCVYCQALACRRCSVNRL